MNRSPSLLPSAFPSVLSCTLIASLSMLNMGSAWSAEQSQEGAKATANSQTKATKSKVTKAKPSKYKAAQAKAKKPSLASKAAPLKLQTSKELPATLASTGGKVTTNPYFTNQPTAILPLAATAAVATAPAAVPATVQAAQTASQPESVASTAPSGSVTAVAAASFAESVQTAPQSVATAIAAALPSLNPPIYGQAAAAPAVNIRVAADQTANTPAPAYKNPYLAYQAQPFALPDLNKLFSIFGNGLKIASPFPAAPAYSAPAYVPPAINVPAFNTSAYNAPAYSAPAAPAFNAPAFNLPTFSLPSLPTYQAPASGATAYATSGYGAPSPTPTAPAAQSATASASSTVGSLFSSLKMMIPLTGDSNILPSIKKVYPTGEKPLVVLNFKCPTEVIGITPPPMKLLHEAVNLGFDGLNKTNLLSFNLQQVCS